MSRLASRLHVLPRALAGGLFRRRQPEQPLRILVAHHLLLGDTLMLTALLARLRCRHPKAAIEMTVAPACLPLYATRPYGVEALAYDPHHPGLTRAITRRGPYDLSLVPGDNRYALLARAAGARWVVAFERDTPGWKNRAADRLVAWPQSATNLADMFASLAGDGDEVFERAAWPAPPCKAFDLPPAPYAVLHVGAGSPLRHWPAPRWLALAIHLQAQGLRPVWSAGPAESGLLAEIDPTGRFASLAGQLDLAQMWHLLAGADLLVATDSGISHLAKLTGTPTACLFGPGSDALFGAGRFWRAHRFEAVIEADFPCRDQTTVFKRTLPWVRRCQRGIDACAANACMQALEVERVAAACERLLRCAR